MTEPATIALDALVPAVPVLVVAPHPDDESIACGGLIAMLRDRAVEVDVLLLSDGTASHPGSLRYPPQVRRGLRREEMREALSLLGVGSSCVDEAGLRDGELPDRGDPDFGDAVRMTEDFLRRWAPGTVIIPWRRDPHRDHCAANAIVRAANAAMVAPAIEREYPVWLQERGSPAQHLLPGEGKAWRLDIGPAVWRKQRAVMAHRSQHGLVIDDDPHGFVLPSRMMAGCLEPWETYYVIEDRT